MKGLRKPKGLSKYEVCKWIFKHKRSVESGCVFYTGAHTAKGQPVVYIDMKPKLIQRLLMELNGVDIERKSVVTTCGAPGCMRPKHLTTKIIRTEHSPETRRKIGKANKGKKVSKETRWRMSEAQFRWRWGHIYRDYL